MPASLVSDVNYLRYRERLHLSYRQFLDEPIEEVEFAIYTWSLDAQRDKLEAARQKPNR